MFANAFGRASRVALACSAALGVLAVGYALATLAPSAFGFQRGERETDREAWQKVPEIFAAMKITEGSRVADVGAGGGFFTIRLAHAVGATGQVFAVDVSATIVRTLRDRVERERIVNVEVVLGAPGDPQLPGSLDAALIVNAYHEMHEHQAMLARIREALKPGGRLVIVEPIARNRGDASRSRQEGRHEIAADFVAGDLRDAGFDIVERRDRFVERPQDRDTEWLIVATPR